MENNIIYGLTDPITNEIRYVGKSERGLDRYGEHILPSALKAQTRKNNWIKSIKKAGLLPGIVIIEVCESKELLNDREIYWIAFYRKINKNLTNLTDGGTGGNTGMSYKKYKPVFAMNTLTGHVKKYDYIWQTEIDGFSPTKVVCVCKGTRLTHKGHIFWYEGSTYKTIKNNRIVPIEVTIKKTGEIFKFDTIKDAANYLDMDRSAISNHLAKKYVSRKYIFKKL